MKWYSVFLSEKSCSLPRMKPCLLGLILVVLPFATHAQKSTLESCYLNLLETRKQIQGNEPVRQGVLKSLFDPNVGKLLLANEAWETCLIGQKIPSLDFVTMNGKKYNDSTLRGKVLVLNFWFKSCAPCVAEMPSLNKLYSEFRDKGVVFIGFATDGEEALKPAYLNTGRFLFDLVPNSRNVAKQFYFMAHPTTYVVDQKGRIVQAWTGYSKFMEAPYDRAKPALVELLAHPAK